ncbi:MAG TPA: hypothetical protein VHH91_13490 [Vicinamibacterales bacterium]|nr:hypothetical protein [Vicinamibacterales bacterium]
MPRALVGGLDHVKFPEMSAAAVREQIRAAIVEAGPQSSWLRPAARSRASVSPS